MDVVFCADYGVLPALHVAAFSVLDRTVDSGDPMQIYVISDVFTEKDMKRLSETLERTGKPYALNLVSVDSKIFSGFNPLNGSLAAYYKLVIPQLIEVERYVYLDVDILCDIDLSPLTKLPMDGIAVAWVAEAPMRHAVDRKVAMDLGNNEQDFYFNSGVLVVNVPEWIKQDITGQCLHYLSHNEALIREQSALNIILHGRSLPLDERYNSIANMRKHWSEMRSHYGSINRLLHFVDYPKPWDLMAELVHPQHELWRSVLQKTTMSSFKSWHKTPARRFPKTFKSWEGYKKGFKDRLLFTGYKYNLLESVKGVSA